MHKEMQMLQILFLSLSSKKDVVMDKMLKQTMTHTATHTKSKQIINHHTAMTNDTLLQLGERHLTSMRTRQKMVVYWWFLASANSGRHGGPGVPD
jgi:hypothetical protein